MKKRFMRLIGATQIFCIILSLLIPIMMFFTTESVAANTSLKETFIKNTRIYNKLICKDNNGKYGLYVKRSDIASVSCDRRGVRIDEGVQFCIFRISDVKAYWGVEDPVLTDYDKPWYSEYVIVYEDHYSDINVINSTDKRVIKQVKPCEPTVFSKNYTFQTVQIRKKFKHSSLCRQK